VAAVLWVKAQRSHFLQMLASPPGSPENRRCRRHFRKAFGRHAPGKDLKTAPRNIICGVLTALTTTRALEYPVSLSTGPITSPFTGVTGFRPSSKVVRDFGRSLVLENHLIPRIWIGRHGRNFTSPLNLVLMVLPFGRLLLT